VADARSGGVTLVLGAGVSIPRRVPSWRRLVASLWTKTFPTQKSPLEHGGDVLPQLFPFTLELIAEKVGDERFSDLLRDELYAEVAPPTRAWFRAHPAETLALLARLLVAEHARGGARRVMRVISFNVDDLLEQAVHVLAPRRLSRQAPLLKVVARASQHPAHGAAGAPIPVYHVHGYIPARASAPWHERSPDTLVFTDLQYWASSASPLSYANRVMAAALHDSHCVFLGTSMTDINVLRWLALRTNEIRIDKAAQFALRPRPSPRGARRALQAALGRHYWCRTASDDPTGVVSRAMALRGIRAVDIAPTWGGAELGALLTDCFPS
jgi:hypothetical protein